MNRSSTASHRDEVGAMKSCHEVDARRLSIGTSEKPTRQDRHACTFLLTGLHPAQTSQDETSSNFIRWEPCLLVLKYWCTFVSVTVSLQAEAPTRNSNRHVIAPSRCCSPRHRSRIVCAPRHRMCATSSLAHCMRERCMPFPCATRAEPERPEPSREQAQGGLAREVQSRCLYSLSSELSCSL